jgi:crotonobetainyl-CoA:carnitine CoA-transferase CaiB-like acyl-CoA transferase
VVKIGAPPRKLGVQIERAWWSYGAGRGMLRARIDVKASEGHEAFLALAERAGAVVESFPPACRRLRRVGSEPAGCHPCWKACWAGV